MSDSPKSHSVAFAFDVDGVFLRGNDKLPGGAEALSLLQQLNVPYMFLTNGGGYVEDDKAAVMSDIIEFPIKGSEVQVAHTPMRDLAEKYGDKAVLIIGKSRIHQIAKAYGFKHVYDVSDLHHEDPYIFPEHDPIPKDVEFDHSHPPRTLKAKIEVVLCFMESANFQRDLQVIVDIARSNGTPGTLVEEQEIPIFFSGPDMEMVNEFPINRIGPGVFPELVDHCFKMVTGKPLKYEIFGKPYENTYNYAKKKLSEIAKEKGHDGVENIYMVGDNPLSDIKGAIGAGWKSCLLKTGVYQGKENSKEYPATFFVNGVLDAVKAALINEGYTLPQ